MSGYVLVSIDVVPLVDGGTEWRIYGWRGAYDGDWLDTLLVEHEALKAAFRAGVPVMLGNGGRVAATAAKLAGEAV